VLTMDPNHLAAQAELRSLGEAEPTPALSRR
jgi:hypothetical protein